MISENILATIGNTPVVDVSYFSPKKSVKIVAKLEGVNPGGSVKDRVALFLVKSAQERGLLSSNTILIEPTSGNTGIGLAMIAALFKYRFIAVMPESASIERRRILRHFGAEIILTDGVKGTNFAIETTHELLRQNRDYLMLDQFTNQANLLAHYQTTGNEIWNQVTGITHFVAGMGTGGTLMGVRQRLKEMDSKIKVIGVEPKVGSKIQGLRNMTAYTPPIFQPQLLDGKLEAIDDEAFDLARNLHRKLGISAGISSGAALWGAIEVAKSIEIGTVATLFPDRSDRYLSTELFS